MVDRVLIPPPGIGTLSLTKAEYEAALIPIDKPKRAEAPPLTASGPTRHVAPPAISSIDPVENPPRFRYIRLKEVCARVGLRASSIYRPMSLGQFPRQVKLLERSSAWVESEVEAFMGARAAERDIHSDAVVAA
jgi:prophage regulatory protein